MLEPLASAQDQKSAIASEAAKIRWKDHRLPDVPRVLEGFKSELNLAGVKIPCAVISGPRGIQRVLTENGITYAILGERSGASKRLKKAASEEGALLPLFVAPSQLKPFISKELEDGPLKAHRLSGWRQDRAGVRRQRAGCRLQHLAQRPAGGSSSGTTIAEGAKGRTLTRALAETGIVALVDEATGYEKVRPQNALQRYLEILVQKKLATSPRNYR